MKTSKVLKLGPLLLVMGMTWFLQMSFMDVTTIQEHKPQKYIVTIEKMKFNPQNLMVHKGDTVVWINKDFYQHDVTELHQQKWTSKPMNQGDMFTKVITTDVDYFCSLHKVMTGTIRIAK